MVNDPAEIAGSREQPGAAICDRGPKRGRNRYRERYAASAAKLVGVTELDRRIRHERALASQQRHQLWADMVPTARPAALGDLGPDGGFQFQNTHRINLSRIASDRS